MSTLRRPVGTFAIVNSDDLATMSDNELQYRANRLYNEVQHDGSRDRQRHIEIELAYCQREIDIRMKTYELHAEYLTSSMGCENEENPIVLA